MRATDQDSHHADRDPRQMKLTRTGEKVDEAPGVVGKRGYLSVGGESFPTIERGGKYVALPSGTFRCVMEANASKGRCFRVATNGEEGHGVKTQSGDWAAILIHSANKPSDLLGCVAPGMIRTSGGVAQSRKAMERIFVLLGGFSAGSSFLLNVD